ncbi:MAG: hypothetical protein ACLQBD_22940 [Syntrophobacteraceae bacterium]
MFDFVAAFPYSERHLARLFKADIKIGIFDYLRLYRSLMASVGLSVSPRTITTPKVSACILPTLDPR